MSAVHQTLKTYPNVQNTPQLLSKGIWHKSQEVIKMVNMWL